jgi:hypothetical protein
MSMLKCLCSLEVRTFSFHGMLCLTYWYPLHVFIRRQRIGTEEAGDLTQAFFARLLEKNFIAAAVEEKGRFRSFLLVALERFLINEREHARAQKRGGGQILPPTGERYLSTALVAEARAGVAD